MQTDYPCVTPAPGLPAPLRACAAASMKRMTVLLASSALLAGCAGGITKVELDPATPTVCDGGNPPVCGILAGQTVNFKVWGQGKCDAVGIGFGDGRTRNITTSQNSISQVDFGGNGAPLVPLPVPTTYDSRTWPGPKTVHAYSVSNCVGEATLPLNILRGTSTGAHAEFELGFGQPTPKACSFVPNALSLRKNTKVQIIARPNTTIDFGCAFSGCVHDADGEKNSVAPSNFAFPGMVKYSLILRVGNQVVQGSANVSFTAAHSGTLETCVNDDPNALSDNTGAWGLSISVDERQAAP